VLGRATGNTNTQDSSRPRLGGSHHLPLYSIFWTSPRGPHPNGFSLPGLPRDSRVGVTKSCQLGLPGLWSPITLREDIGSKCDLKQSCSSRRELSNSMWHVVYSQVNWVDSWLFLVGSQTGSSTPDPSFGHNLCFRCPNEQCEPILDIYVPRDFQWYKECHKLLSFDPLKSVSEVSGVHRDSISQSGSCLGSVRAHSLTLSYTPGSLWCDSRASPWPAPLQPLCLGHEPKARVTTIIIQNKISTFNTLKLFHDYL